MESARGPLPRLPLGVFCLVHTGLFAWAALTLPWRSRSLWAVFFGALALAHALTALATLVKAERLAALTLRMLSVLSALSALGLTWVVLSSSLYLIELYRGLGPLLVAGIVISWLVLLLLTLPIAAWGATRVWREEIAKKRTWWMAGIALAFVVASAIWVARSARGVPLHDQSESSLGQAIRRVWARQRPNPATDSATLSLFTEEPASCPEDVLASPFTALVTYVSEAPRVAHICLQARSSSDLLAQIESIFTRDSPRPALMKLDVLTRAQVLEPGSLLDPFKLRPALDGVCSGRNCLAPWQLVALDAFASYRPFAAVKDASFGISLPWIAEKLRAPGPLLRVEAASFVLDGAGVRSLRRLRAVPQRAERERLSRAALLAEKHILLSQRESGEFRYLLDPFRGTTEPQNVNLARQAGTALILCEHDATPSNREVIVRALKLLQQSERRAGASSSLSQDEHTARLGHTALPLAAFLSCRPKLGGEYDGLIARLGQFLLTMQRPDGSFFPEFDYASARPTGRHEGLYSAGQAVLALVLLEQRWQGLSDKGGLERRRIGLAIERAMAYYSGPYWPAPLHDLFFVEENWHCLAARAALASRRNDAYERFCTDYVQFKSRFILEPGAGNQDLRGAYGVSPALPVHNTATAGFGEALAAAIAVKRARGEATLDDEALLLRVLEFLLASQWQDANCFACTRQHFVLGGFSEHYAGPALRIDYVQHAMAALHHGRRAVYGD
ncbi:MAG TPA: hypothetical protein VI072_25660 [Polyangiaceae bacterium]